MEEVTERMFLNQLQPYFEMLDNINKDLTEIIRNNENNDPSKNEIIFYRITAELLRLLPYKYDERKDKIEIDDDSGILLLKDKRIDFIYEKYVKILSWHNFHDTLKDLHIIRNKYIHEPHNIAYVYSVGGKSICSMGLYYKKELLSISSISLAPIVNYLNKIFDEIKNVALEIVEKDDEYKKYPYYKVLTDKAFSEKWNYTLMPQYVIWGWNEPLELKKEEDSVTVKFEKVLKRDIDLLLISRLINNKRIFNSFIKKIGLKGYKLISIEHSKFDQELRESDITLIIQNDFEKIGVLIEDKIDAPAMELQPERYIDRGNKGKENNLYDDFAVVLIAPKKYLDTNNSAKKYEYKISYEELKDIMKKDEYAVALLDEAIK